MPLDGVTTDFNHLPRGSRAADAPGAELAEIALLHFEGMMDVPAAPDDRVGLA